jgi:hypothetical protein
MVEQDIKNESSNDTMYVDERMVEKEIKNLQLASNEQSFSCSAKLMLEKRSAKNDLHKFSKYFSKQWLSH